MRDIPELLSRVVQTRDELKHAERDVERARASFREAVRAAHARGVSYSLIGQTLGVSRQWVSELARDG
jgi:hypothetical protein